MGNGIFHVTLTNMGERACQDRLWPRWLYLTGGGLSVHLRCTIQQVQVVVENRNCNNSGQWRWRGEGERQGASERVSE